MPNSLFPLLFLLLTPITAQSPDDDKPILSCVDLACPIRPNSITAQCTLSNTTYTGLGTARIPPPFSSLSWTQAIASSDDVPSRTRTFTKDFYLSSSAPPLANDTAAACAVFFTQTTEAADWDPVPNRLLSQGTCAEAMSAECVVRMVRRARDMQVQGGEDVCERLRRAFEGEVTEACEEFSGEGGWKGVEVRALTGENAPRAFTREENGGSECWPVKEEESRVAVVARFNTTGGFMAKEIFDNLYKMTPILTVMFPAGNSRAEPKVEAQLTCVKAIDETTASVANKSNGVPNSSWSLEAWRPMPFIAALGAVAFTMCMS